MNVGKVDYKSLSVPEGYKCSGCGVKGVKLWRQYQTIADAIALLCADCAVKDQGVDYEVDEDGKHADPDVGGQRCDQISWMVPAVPTVEGDTYWGYTSVPTLGVAWWKSLPTRLLVDPAEHAERIRMTLLNQLEDLEYLLELERKMSRERIRKLESQLDAECDR